MNITNIINKILSKIECQICDEKFIKLTYKQYNEFCVKNKQLLPENFEDDNCCRIYEDRFECIKCKNMVCQHCYWNFKNHKYEPHIDDMGAYAAGGMLDDDGLAEGCPGEDCPIICPFCRTKDYKIYYGNKIPYELLYELRNQRLK